MRTSRSGDGRRDAGEPRFASRAGWHGLIGLGAVLCAAVPVASCDLERPAPATDGDVRSYGIRDRMTMRVRRRSGDESFRFGVDAIAAFQPLTPDSARAWIDEANGFTAARNRRVESEPRFVIRRPFVLVRDGEGHFRSVERPSVPGDLPASQQFLRSLVEIFENFDPPLPAQRLEPGASWTDSFSFERDGDRGPRAYTQTATYRVLRDTTIAGRPALVLNVTGETVRDGAPDEDRMNGTATWVIFPDGTTVAARSRSEGALSGQDVARMGMGADSVEYEATRSVELLDP